MAISDKIGKHLGGLNSLKMFIEGNGTGVVQVFTGNPRSLHFTPVELRVPENVTAILHGPFVVSCCRAPGDSLFRASMRYLMEVAEYANRVGIKKIVTHIGGPTQGYENREKECLKAFLDQWNYNCWERQWGIELCLENDAGSKAGRTIGSVEVLSRAVKYFKSPNIKLCFDTEHAWAYGLEPTPELIDQLLPYLGVIHLNSLPKNVAKGSHLDRHSETLLSSTHESQIPNLLAIAERAIANDIPCVLERDLALADMDLEFLRESLNGNC